MVTAHLQSLLEVLPESPGVYIMKNDKGEVIYVGKAKVLKNRVRQYFHPSENHTAKTLAMVEKIATFDYITVSNEAEAFILECNMIKKYRPHYNIMLRDDKHYPYLKLDTSTDFPRLEIVRKVNPKDKAKYFGPYFSATSMKEVLGVVQKLFKLRSCRKDIAKAIAGGERPCLNAHIGRCLAPCSGKVSAEEYREVVNQVADFLSGNEDELIHDLKAAMMTAAEEMRYEQAARYRDSIAAVEKILTQRQRVAKYGNENWDIIGIHRDSTTVMVQLFTLRAGRVSGSNSFDMTASVESDRNCEVLTAFIKQYYHSANTVPKLILCQEEPAEKEELESWLTQMQGSNVKINVPQRGEKKKLIDMAADNASAALEKLKNQRQREWERTGGALEDLAAILGLEQPPQRIECFDISNIQGTDQVASMVVFEDGKPAKSQYRHFKIKTVQGPNDFASMKEVVGRRFRRGLEEKKNGMTTGFAHFPDLLIVDGGAIQLKFALEILHELGINLPTVGLAEREEEIYLPGEKEPLRLSKLSAALHLMQYIRDEAHRFAITFHRSLRNKRTISSLLDEAPGIGPARKKALMLHFPSINAIKKASVKDLEKVRGISRKTAEELYAFLHDEKKKPEDDGSVVEQ